MKTWQVSFAAGQASAPEIAFEDGQLSIALRFAMPEAKEALRKRMEKPLTLSAAAQPGDRIDVSCSGARLALYVNDRLADEEWPCGTCGFPKAVRGIPGFTVTDTPRTDAFPLRTVRGIQGFAPGNGVNVGDCMPMPDGELLRIFYLYDRRHHGSKWSLGAPQGAQITTNDLKTWTMQPMAVGIDDPSEGSICTGSVIRDGDTWYAFYAIRACDGSPARMTASVSHDGVHFEKTHRAFALPEPYDAATARDPKVYREGDRFVMLVTTSYGAEGCLARLESPDLESWTLIGPELLTQEHQPECPDHFFFGGHEYLVFGRAGTTHYRIRGGDGQWHAPAGEDVIVDSHLRVPKAAVWQGRLLFAGFVVLPDVPAWGGTMELWEGFADEQGSLRFEKLCTEAPACAG